MMFTVQELPLYAQRRPPRKRFMAQFSDGEAVYFGQPGGTTYIDGASKATKRGYIARHGTGTEDWSDKGRRTPGFLSRRILWGAHQNIALNVALLGGRYVPS